MYKVGAVGDFENTAYFGAIGAEVFCPKSAEDAARIIKKLTLADYAVIYVSEKYYDPSLRKSGALTPAIIPLPLGGSQGKGTDGIRACVKRAIGADMAFDN